MQQSSRWQQLQTLKDVFDAGFMPLKEYSFRKQQLLNDLNTTSTNTNTPTTTTNISNTTPSTNVTNWNTIQPERVTKYSFDITSLQWSTSSCIVKINESPFAQGSLRQVHHLLQLEPPNPHPLVAKRFLSQSHSSNRKQYLNEIILQAHCLEYANLFNRHHPPKCVEFAVAWLIELIDRPGSPLLAVERFLGGEYAKHNNNFGGVSDDDRNTPQAFSHFSWEASGGEVLICDLQGVQKKSGGGDMFTDPQLHTRDGRGLAKGDLGQQGIDLFMASHRCNAVCRYLRLGGAIDMCLDMDMEGGTLPEEREMERERVLQLDMGLSELDGMGDDDHGGNRSNHIGLYRQEGKSDRSSNCICC